MLQWTLSWIDRLPPELAASRPWLLIFRAWGLLLTGEVTPIPDCLQRAQQAGATADAAPEMAGHVAAIRAYVAALGGTCLPPSLRRIRRWPSLNRTT